MFRIYFGIAKKSQRSQSLEIFGDAEGFSYNSCIRGYEGERGKEKGTSALVLLENYGLTIKKS